jgi:hypothetical protein
MDPSVPAYFQAHTPLRMRERLESNGTETRSTPTPQPLDFDHVYDNFRSLASPIPDASQPYWQRQNYDLPSQPHRHHSADHSSEGRALDDENETIQMSDNESVASSESSEYSSPMGLIIANIENIVNSVREAHELLFTEDGTYTCTKVVLMSCVSPCHVFVSQLAFAILVAELRRITPLGSELLDNLLACMTHGLHKRIDSDLASGATSQPSELPQPLPGTPNHTHGGHITSAREPGWVVVGEEDARPRPMRNVSAWTAFKIVIGTVDDTDACDTLIQDHPNVSFA